ncbi:MAG: 1-acyl-sn-glycerol-3-phosphate acyltransferase [Desulfobacteraceae bacterium]|nr:1-acyl-sn-glycerol-3-phosphate acyltransferase [Desulfobacteraceae bacterium]MBC2757562.1 1-acyl-sn-glycerol-3-phosphate acyltransferase [Desulfobacteraceae bacterium]
MNAKAKIFFYFQYVLGRLTVFITAPLILLAIKAAGYRVRDLNKVRRTVREMMDIHQGPWLICANHLTLIDSVILAYAMMPTYRYMLQYKLLPWNVPEQMNFNSNIFVGLACFLTKCIPIIRGGDRDAVKSTLAKCGYLLNKGENLMIFPEGTRSRSGRVNTEDFPYGVGRLVCNISDCRVMAIYLRGDGQKTYSNFPRYGETFFMTVEECRPKTELKGLRAQRDCSRQIVEHLLKMEKDYFDSCGQ